VTKSQGGEREPPWRTEFRKTSIARIDWFCTYQFSPLFYLLGVVSMPLAFVFAALHPLLIPEIVYGLIVGSTGIPAWLLVDDWGDEQGLGYYSWKKLKVQIWLQLGGAVRCAFRHLHGEHRERTPS